MNPPARQPKQFRFALSKQHRERMPGFSLLEMIIVLSIMAGMMVMVWPNLQRSLQKAVLEEAAATVRSVLDEARYQAMLQGECWFVRFEHDSGWLRSGSFHDFAHHADSAAASGSGTPLSFSLANTAEDLGIEGDAAANATSYRLPRIHRLPDSIRVVEVLWSTRIPAVDVDADEILEQPDGPDGSACWVPLLANGSSKDFSIRLQDSTTGKSIWVLFFGATGSIETTL